MAKLAKNLATLLVMGLPAWVVVAGLVRDEPASLVVVLDEPDVRVWVGDREYGAGTREVGPIALKPGPYRVRVTRDGDTLYARPVTLEAGRQTEVRAEWRSYAAAGEPGRPAVRGPKLDRGREFAGHGSSVTAVGFGGDGDALSMGADSSLLVWDLLDGRPRRPIEAQGGLIKGMVVLGDGRRVLTVGCGGSLAVSDVATGAEVRSIPTGETSDVRCAAASADGRQVALGFGNSVVKVFDAGSGAERRSFRVWPAAPGGLAFAPDGRTLIAGLVGSPQAAHAVVVYDLAAGRVVRRLQGHKGPVWGVAFLPDGRRAVSASGDRTMRLWDVTDGRELRRFDDHPGVVRCVAVSPDGRRALTGTGHRWSYSGGWQAADVYGVHVWDLDDGRLLGRFETEAPVQCLALSPDGLRALAGGEDQLVHAWDLPRWTQPS